MRQGWGGGANKSRGLVLRMAQADNGTGEGERTRCGEAVDAVREIADACLGGCSTSRLKVERGWSGGADTKSFRIPGAPNSGPTRTKIARSRCKKSQSFTKTQMLTIA